MKKIIYSLLFCLLSYSTQALDSASAYRSWITACHEIGMSIPEKGLLNKKKFKLQIPMKRYTELVIEIYNDEKILYISADLFSDADCNFFEISYFKFKYSFTNNVDEKVLKLEAADQISNVDIYKYLKFDENNRIILEDLDGNLLEFNSTPFL